ncbi:MAG: DUF72 domain-containing protein [Anaerolineae bacterium]|nr:DUF72 domain-containing protein [Anaerolineae bacterium]
MTNWHIGTMGFAYDGWVGSLYPVGLSSRHYLSHYSQYFDAVEVDSTFYGIPRPEQVQRWTAVTPPHFTFCPKTPRAITHDAPLLEGIPLMHQFLEVMELFGDKLGVILIQFGPEFSHHHFNDLRHFLQALPTDKRFAVEFRHRSWDTPGTAVLLEEHHVCLVAANYLYMPHTIHRTADFLYLRCIGPHGQFGTKDRELIDKTQELQRWAAQMQPHLTAVHDIYVFINNDYSGFSPATCNRFKQIVGLPVQEIRPLVQGRLF